MTERRVFGWDVGGAHVKACRLERGRVVDVMQWACPLWQGLAHLAAVLAAAHARWPGLAAADHAITMTGEMVDLFANREAGVQGIADAMARGLTTAPGAPPTPPASPAAPSALPSTPAAPGAPPAAPSAPAAARAGRVRFFAGDEAWCGAHEVASRWPAIASANWLATARHAALALGGVRDGCADRAEREVGDIRDLHDIHDLRDSRDLRDSHDHHDGGTGHADDDAPEGVLIDIGSTTTDLIAFRRGGALTLSRSDAERLAGGELIYHGVVRTPLCAVAQRIAWRGVPHHVMNEFFATAADAYRLTGELDPAHDLHPSADGAAKDVPATQQRLARMIGLDARDAAAAEWLGFARAWRAAQVALLGDELRRVLDRHRLGPRTVIVSAGCGAFLVPDVMARAQAPGAAPLRLASYGHDVARVARVAEAAASIAGWSPATGAAPMLAQTAPPAAPPAITRDRAALQRAAQVCAPCVAVAALFERELR